MSEPQFTKPMSSLALQIFGLAQEAATPLRILPMLHLSDLAERIARDLAACAAIQIGAVVAPEWGDLPELVRTRYRQLAERAIQTIDPQVRLDAANEAVLVTDEWMNGPYGGVPESIPTTVEVARTAIAHYEASLSQMRGRS